MRLYYLSIVSLLMAFSADETLAFRQQRPPTGAAVFVAENLRAGGAKKPSSSSSSWTTTPTQLNAAWPLKDDPKGMPADYGVTLARIGFTTAATVLTWYAATNRCGAVLASSATTLVSSLMAPGLGQAAMCGTFAGMSNAAILLPTRQLAITLGLMTSLLFEIMIHRRNMYLGMGGRLGLTAFIGVNALALYRGVSAVSSSGTESAPWLGMATFGALGSMATIALREASDDSAAADPVRAADVVGLLAALLVGVCPGYTEQAALAIYQGAFAGMSLPSRLMRGRVPGAAQTQAASAYTPSAARLLVSFGITGALGGLVHALTIYRGWWLGGWGGKAGFCAFLGVLLFRGLSKTTRLVKTMIVGESTITASAS